MDRCVVPIPFLAAIGMQADMRERTFVPMIFSRRRRIVSCRFGGLTTEANAFTCFCQSAERRLSAPRTAQDGIRDPLPDLVRFAARRLCTYAIERHFHIRQGSAIEASVNHGTRFPS